MGNYPSSVNSGSLSTPVHGVFTHFPDIDYTPSSTTASTTTASTTTASTTTASTTTEDKNTPWWVWIIVVLVVLGIGGAVASRK